MKGIFLCIYCSTTNHSENLTCASLSNPGWLHFQAVCYCIHFGVVSFPLMVVSSFRLSALGQWMPKALITFINFHNITIFMVGLKALKSLTSLGHSFLHMPCHIETAGLSLASPQSAMANFILQSPDLSLRCFRVALLVGGTCNEMHHILHIVSKALSVAARQVIQLQQWCHIQCKNTTQVLPLYSAMPGGWAAYLATTLLSRLFSLRYMSKGLLYLLMYSEIHHLGITSVSMWTKHNRKCILINAFRCPRIFWMLH